MSCPPSSTSCGSRAIHTEEAGRLLCRTLGTRLTEANSDALEVAIDAAIEAQAIERKGGFLRLPGSPVVVRYRGGDCEVTKPELIPPEEYEEAIRLVLKKEFGLHPEALHSSVVRLMASSALASASRTSSSALSSV